jgi:transcription antitermination factor NusG
MHCEELVSSSEPVMRAAPDAAEPADFGTPRWYVLFVRSNQEKRVALGLNQRGVQHLLPCYSSLRQWKDRRVRLEMPLFPGYVFVRLALVDRLRALMVPNVISMVGRRDSPAVISAQEIAWIESGIARGLAEPHVYLSAGQRVIIVDGALSGMRGILVRRCNGTRVVVAIESIARSFAVEVDAGAVQVIEDSAPPTEKKLHCGRRGNLAANGCSRDALDRRTLVQSCNRNGN